MTIYEEIEAEVNRARKLFDPFNSPHEGYAILLEEMDELKEQVWRFNLTKNRDTRSAMRSEAVQVAAMAIRFIEDLLSGKRER